jgi:hypothetical protein
MFHARCRRRLRRFDGWSRFGDLGVFAGDLGGHRSWRRPYGRRRRARGPSAFTILLAGLAVFALVRLLTASNRPNLSTAQKVALGALVLLVGSVLLSLRRSARRYNWSV